jgi:ATP/ADP translocase
LDTNSILTSGLFLVAAFILIGLLKSIIKKMPNTLLTMVIVVAGIAFALTFTVVSLLIIFLAIYNDSVATLGKTSTISMIIGIVAFVLAAEILWQRYREKTPKK